MSMTPSILPSPAPERTQTQEMILRTLESTAATADWFPHRQMRSRPRYSQVEFVPEGSDPTGTRDEGDEPSSGKHDRGELPGQGLILGIGPGGEASGSRSYGEELRP